MYVQYLKRFNCNRGSEFSTQRIMLYNVYTTAVSVPATVPGVIQDLRPLSRQNRKAHAITAYSPNRNRVLLAQTGAIGMHMLGAWVDKVVRLSTQ